MAWLDDFCAHLSKTSRVNTISIHMRNIRAVVNYAIDNEMTTYYAFRHYKIKNEATCKRNFDVEVEPWTADAAIYTVQPNDAHNTTS